MRELGSDSSALGVARLYAPWVGTMVIDRADEAQAGAIEELGMECLVADTIMSSPERAASLANLVLTAGR